MIKLSQVKINKYKSIQSPQTVPIDPAITTIVGMNESGKTSFLTAIAKTNYFIEDSDFKFDMTLDYPRSELIDFQSSEEDACIVECKYEISNELLHAVAIEVGSDVFVAKNFTHAWHYKAKKSYSVDGILANTKKYLEFLTATYELSNETKEIIKNTPSLRDIISVASKDGDTQLEELKITVQNIINKGSPNWPNDLASYIYNIYIKPKMPKFWYFDDYYPLAGKININQLKDNGATDEKSKTSMALLELAKIKPDDILNASSDAEYEKFIALLEASSNKITNEIFKYWSTNKNLDIDFKIQHITGSQNTPEKVLDIRVKSQRHKITLPLDRRSKGFNWFFSFIVWFSKIQADKNSDYVLLLDEPGLNLHASAQADLLKFFEELSKKYQIIYTTHSPFMVETAHLDRVRTCFETDSGTIISDSIQEKDPNTLFPLQAALGYDIAQNLFISKNNLLVEGPADLIYLTVLSSILEANKRVGLKDGITIVPVGGLDKVTTFISLLRGSKLNVVCLLDTFTDQKGRQRVVDLIAQKIIKDKHIRFFDEFANTGKATADIEDLFHKEDYLKIFNQAFTQDYEEIKISDLNDSLDTIILQINKKISKDRFNHYRPANKLNQLGVGIDFFDAETLNNFESMFKEINKLF